MAFDDALVSRIRDQLRGRADISERKMFGGLAFMLDNKMFAGVVGTDLMARVGPAGYEAALARPHVREMDFTGRPMTGMVYVEPAGIPDEESLRSWLEESEAYAATVKPSKPKKRTARTHRSD